MELNKIHQKDCFELLAGLDDNSADLIFLDPNYQDWGKLIADGLVGECFRILKETGNILMFTKKPYDYELRNQINYCFRNEIIWKYIKTGNWVSNKMPTYSYHKIFWCCGKDFFFNPRTGMPYSSNTKQGNKGYLVFDGYKEKSKPFFNSEEGVWLNDLLNIERKREDGGNIPTKPIELCQILIRCFSPKGGLIIDPFMGGGNILVTAKKEGRNYIGGDIEKSCFDFVTDKLLKTEYELF